MPKAIKFELSGNTAFFKKPDVNEYAYFTYNNIHKIALLGMLGAIIGLGGYTQQGKNQYPEFYEKLRDLKVAIVPDKSKNGIYTKKIQTFNNSVGYASLEEGGNLIVREQWIEDPKWTIYLLINQKINKGLEEKLEDYLVNSKAVYIPYLGKNDHPAIIKDVEVLDLEEKKLEYIDSIFIEDQVEINNFDCRGKVEYKIKEIAPYQLQETYNFYEYKEFVYTNYLIENPDKIENLYSDKELSLFFY